MSQINEYIEKYIPKDYGKIEHEDGALDCSLGVDNTPIPKYVMDTLRIIPMDEIKMYPHDEYIFNELCERLLDRYTDTEPNLTKDNIHFGCGSFDILCHLNLLYANCNKKVLGHAPQFTAYVDHTHCIGANRITYNLPKDDNYKFNVDDFCKMIVDEKPNLVVCENPNNPTGQAYEKNDLKKIIEACEKTGSAVVFDEAYGDYLDSVKYSAIGLIKEAEANGVDCYVTRTFSKGYGMAGMRVGYVIGPAHGISELKKMITPFNCNELARQLAVSMLSKSIDYLIPIRESTIDRNKMFYEELKKLGTLKVAETMIETPLSVLYVDDPEVDLCAEFAKVGITVVSCATYENMGKNMVRLMLPEDMLRLCRQLGKLDLPKIK